jgi:1-deoxy-D-xylulose-5-phosphate reductoisomerase
MKSITILGSTGSIGRSTLDVIAAHPDEFSIYALTANSNWQLLLEQCLQFKPRYAVIQNPDFAKELMTGLQHAKIDCEVLVGDKALVAVSTAVEVDLVMAAIVGAAGLLPTLSAAQAGKRVLLANKEALVMAGDLFKQAVQNHHAVLLPIDSEHNAIFQCLPSGFIAMVPTAQTNGIKKIILTASGGPFLTTPLEELEHVTPLQAYTHPNWSMGRKISVDSATMMNKALEVIEAHYLFGLKPEQIEVLIHPQSIVHSMVEYCDGSILAEMANPDMRVPIAYALGWPARLSSGVKSLNLINQRLDFAVLDLQRFPCLSLAYHCLKEGGTTSTILNAANEVAVSAFLAEQIKFTDIYPVVSETLSRVPSHSASDLGQILHDDGIAREFANNYLTKLQKQHVNRYNAPILSHKG